MVFKMENHEKLKIVSGILLIISAITHIGQLLFVGFELHDIGAALYGSSYGVLGFLLILVSCKDISLIWNKIITLVGVILPLVGGILGLNRLINIEIGIHGEINWFIVLHVIIDCIVIPSCLYSLIKICKS